MTVLKIEYNEWEKGLKSLFAEYQLVGPVRQKEGVEFEDLNENQLPDMAFSNTRMSAKSRVYPQSQIMFTFDLDESHEGHHIMRPVPKAEKRQVILGIRPCDAAAYLVAKKNFDTNEYRDPYWSDQYERTILVGLACDDPGKTCFCPSVGLGPYSEKGLDILLSSDGDSYQAKIITEKGKALADNAGWKVAGDESVFKSGKESAENKITATIETDRLPEQVAKTLFDAPFWDDLAFGCLNCGTCTYSCPTCWCFDIQDESKGTDGVRMRNWDSCMSSLFTLEGSGHNPRPEKSQRVRQRFMHKLKYYVDKYGENIMCVGCGRCVRLCPVNIDIRKISEVMNNYQPHG